jgi:quaternary ammonium compound-resistance protein SugE
MRCQISLAPCGHIPFSADFIISTSGSSFRYTHVWAFFLKRSDGFTRIWPTAITIATMLVSVGLLSMSMRALPLGTAYVIWTGIGAVGALLVGIWLLGEPVSPLRSIAAALIIVGVILMKIATPD